MTQDKLPDTLYSLKTQLVYSLCIPSFFFIFILIFNPFDLKGMYDMDRGRMSFNITIVTLIILGSVLVTRGIYFFLIHFFKFTWLSYIFWCMLEFVSMFQFVTLYNCLVFHLHYFDALSQTAWYISTIMVLPYSIVTMAAIIRDWQQTRTEIPVQESNLRMRFFDDTKKLKLVVAASMILYIEAEYNYVRIYYLDANVVKNYQLRSSMKSLEPVCSKYGLVRCQRSFFVNPVHVRALSKDKDGTICAQLDHEGVRSIPVSKTYYDVLSSLL